MAPPVDFIDPTAGGNTLTIPLAMRPADLTGLVVGLLDNSKEQGDVILQTVGEVLQQDYGVAAVLLRRKAHYSKPALPVLLDEMAGTAQVAIAAVGG